MSSNYYLPYFNYDTRHIKIERDHKLIHCCTVLKVVTLLYNMRILSPFLIFYQLSFISN